MGNDVICACYCSVPWCSHSLLTRVDKVQGPPRYKGPPSATCIVQVLLINKNWVTKLSQTCYCVNVRHILMKAKLVHSLTVPGFHLLLKTYLFSQSYPPNLSHTQHKVPHYRARPPSTVVRKGLDPHRCGRHKWTTFMGQMDCVCNFAVIFNNKKNLDALNWLLHTNIFLESSES